MPDFPRALPIVAAAFAAIFAPPPPLVPSAWAAEHLIVPDGPRAGDLWDPALTPYVPAIIDALGPDTPHNLGVVRKSVQTGVSVAAIALVSSYIDLAPCRMGYALPTIDSLHEFNREKLNPSLTQTKPIAAKVVPQTSRSAAGSTSNSKRFPGGSLVLMNANSAPDLKSKTLKIGIGDEIDEWADDLDKQGDPWGLFLARFTGFHATGDWKVLALSTPTLAGSSRVDALFEAGTREYWHIPCPGCGQEIVFEFAHLKFERRAPWNAYYAAPCCGRVIESHEKAALLRGGRFIAEDPDAPHRSWHIDALSSQITTWNHIAAAWHEAQGDERKLKTFYNNVLGRAYQMRGDAPDYVKLLERREDFAENIVPAPALLLVAGADVQHSGIWVEISAFAPDRQSWSVSVRWLPGDTTDPERGAFAALSLIYDELFDDAYGGARTIDALGIDAGDGGRANQVYAWVRGRHRAYAIKGMPGWSTPAIASSPTPVNITLRGRRIRRGASLWPVGTWSIKAEFYAQLRKDGRKAGQEVDPPGYAHFADFHTEDHFRQFTAEYIVEKRVGGRTRKVWEGDPENHLLDCRVYAMAMAEHLGLSRKKPEQWAALAAKYGAAAPLPPPDLFESPSLTVEREVASADEAKQPEIPAIAAPFTPPSPGPARQRRIVRSRFMGR